MKDPKEKDQQKDQEQLKSDQQNNADNSQNKEKGHTDGSNWYEHQQVDEIGNEIDPDDVK